MENVDLEIWWSSLAIREKERIARKAQTKAAPDQPLSEALYLYPACTRWWASLTPDRKASIYDHCVVRHGLASKEWNDADPYGGD